MNGITLNKTELAAWRSLIEKPTKSLQLLVAALYLISAMMIPFASDETTALIFVLFCASFYYIQTRTLRALLLPAIPVALLLFVSGSMALPAAFCAVIFGGVAGGFLIATAKGRSAPLLLSLLPLIAFAAAFFFSGSPALAALTLLPLPAAIVAGFAVRLCKPFTASVAAIAAAIAATAVLAATAALATLHLLNPALLPDLLNATADAMLQIMAEQNAFYTEAGLGAIFSIPERSVIVNMLIDLAYLSPALLGVACLIVAFFIWRTLCILLTTLRALPRVPRVFSTPTMSVGAAILFLLSYLVVMIANASKITITGIVAQNVGMLLEPGLALIGVGVLLHRGDRRRSCLSTAITVSMICYLFTAPATAVALAALVGAVVVLIAAYKGMKKNKGEL